MQSLSGKVFAIALSLILGLQNSFVSKSNHRPDWETLRPDGEEFSVLMPRVQLLNQAKSPITRWNWNTRMYISSRPAGPVFAVVSLSAASNQIQPVHGDARVNSYVDAFKILFSAKVRKDAIAKLTLFRKNFA